MSHLPVISGRELVGVLAKIGYALDHQTGSHIILRNQRPPFRRVTVPNHRELAKGTLRQILRDCGLSPEELSELLK